jgi:cytochrome c556
LIKEVDAMSTRFTLAGMMMLALLAGGVWAVAADPEPQPPSLWMKKKLAYSETMLVGLVGEDFDQMAKSARSMNAMNQMEKWVRGTSPEYRTQLKIFQNANEQMIRMADKKNLDGAALAYVQLTLSCVNCHKVVRDRPTEEPVRAK